MLTREPKSSNTFLTFSSVKPSIDFTFSINSLNDFSIPEKCFFKFSNVPEKALLKRSILSFTIGSSLKLLNQSFIATILFFTTSAHLLINTVIFSSAVDIIPLSKTQSLNLVRASPTDAAKSRKFVLTTPTSGFNNLNAVLNTPPITLPIKFKIENKPLNAVFNLSAPFFVNSTKLAVKSRIFSVNPTI